MGASSLYCSRIRASAALWHVRRPGNNGAAACGVHRCTSAASARRQKKRSIFDGRAAAIRTEAYYDEYLHVSYPVLKRGDTTTGTHSNETDSSNSGQDNITHILSTYESQPKRT